MALPITHDAQPDRPAPPQARTLAGSFLLARLGSLFAILPLGVWTVNHLVNQLAAYTSAEEWERSVEGHNSGVTAWFTFGFVLVPLLWHTVWGLLRLGKSRPSPDFSRFSNVRYWVQRLSAVGLLLFLGAHLWLAWFHPRFVEGAPEAFRDIAHEMRFHTPTLVVYCLGVLAIAYHLANGLWSWCMGWGVAVSKSGLAWMERVSVLLFVVLLGVGGLAIYGLYQAGT